MTQRLSDRSPPGPVPPKPPSAPIVKVFVSSTFRDFHRERDELVKTTFPALRDYCARKHIIFVDVDLRWGITEAEAEAGEVLPICLAEIDNCRPYFIGLVGERYGWIPKQIPAELVERQPWLNEHRESSITELEMLYGAIRNSAMAGRRFFYFRSPAYHLGLPAAEQPDYLSDDPAAAGRLERLKRLIRDEARHHRLKLVESYPGPDHLAELVFQDLQQAITADFPDEEYDELEHERLAHRTFVDSRAGILVPRRPLLNDLTGRLSRQPLPVVVSGEPGSGKTSLLVGLALELGEANPGGFLFTHFVGASASSADYAQIIRRFLVEMLDAYGLDGDVPEACGELVECFSRFLPRIPPRPGAVVILDGLDQLADVEDALSYSWLPDRFPEGVRLVVSVYSARAREILARRGWPVVEVPGLTPAEQREIILRYLGRYGKRLDAAQTDTVLGARQTSSPLYLRALLEEIRIFGDYEKLDDRIRHYLAARDPVSLYDMILERLEADYDGRHPGLVRGAFSRLAASRYGLTETELRDLLGVPSAVWSPLQLAVQESLASNLGYITFFHEFLRQAVAARYMGTPEAEKSVHLSLADYFATSPDIARKADELPWQLAQAKESERLRDCLGEFDVFLHLMRRDQGAELLRYWRDLHPRYSPAETYQQALSRYEATNPGPDRLGSRMRQVSNFLSRFGFVREAAAVLQRVRDIDDETYRADYLGELQANRIDNLLALADTLAETGQFESAESLVLQAQEIAEGLPGDHPADDARVLNSLAYVRKNLERFAEAERDYRAAIALDPLPAYRSNLATLLKRTGRADDAERIYRDIAEGLPEDDNLRAVCLANRGDILLERGELEEAERCYRRAVDITRAQLGPRHYQLAVNLGRLADILTRRMNPVEAATVMSEAVSILETTLGPGHWRTKDAREQQQMIELMKSIHERMTGRRTPPAEDPP